MSELKPRFVGIAGPSGSGKTELANRLAAAIPDTTLFSLDCYYKGLGHLAPEERALCNFDDPAMLDWDLIAAHAAALSQGLAIDEPVYSFESHIRLPETVRVTPGSLNTRPPCAPAPNNTCSPPPVSPTSPSPACSPSTPPSMPFCASSGML